MLRSMCASLWRQHSLRASSSPPFRSPSSLSIDSSSSSIPPVFRFQLLLWVFFLHVCQKMSNALPWLFNLIYNNIEPAICVQSICQGLGMSVASLLLSILISSPLFLYTQLEVSPLWNHFWNDGFWWRKSLTGLFEIRLWKTLWTTTQLLTALKTGLSQVPRWER